MQLLQKNDCNDKEFVLFSASSASIDPALKGGFYWKQSGKKVTLSMLSGFEKIVEERIQEALRKGEFDNLPGSGKPLEFEDSSSIAEDLRLAYKILKNADCLPPEIELKKEIHKTEDLLACMEDTADKYRTMKKLNYLIMKLNLLKNTSVMFEEPEHYTEKLVERFGSKELSKIK